MGKLGALHGGKKVRHRKGYELIRVTQAKKA